MTETDVDSGRTDLGPVDYLIIEFPGAQFTGEAVPHLLDLVDRAVIRILDLVFVMKGDDGAIRGLELSEIVHDSELDFAVFEGASSGLLDDEDIGRAGSVLEPGSAAAVMVYENVWAAPLAAALRRGGAHLVSTGRIPVEDLMSVIQD